MNILIITDRLAIGGAETHIYELARALRGRGHTVSLAAERGEFTAKLENEGFAVHSLPLATKSPVSLWLAHTGLCRLLDVGRFDLVHAHARLPAFLAAPLCRRRGIPMLTTAHWVFSTRALRGRLCEWGERCFAVSPDIANYLMREYGIPPSRITVIENGIDTEAFAPRERTGGGRLLHISRLDAGRAACAEALLSVARELAAGGTCRSLTIVGDGGRFAAISRAAREANRAIGWDFIRMVGGVSDVRPYLYEADLFVGVSRAALEAMASGMPSILAGDEGYLSLFGRENEEAAQESNFCCRGAPALSPAVLRRDIEAAFRRDDLRQIGEYNASYVREHYSIAKMAKITEDVYREAIECPPLTVCGYYGAKNTGDDAAGKILERQLTAEGFRCIRFLGRRAEKGILPPLTALSPRLFARRGGIFILGGGNLLQNETSNRSLFYYTRLLRRANRAGQKTVVMGGIGRLTERGKRMARQALEKTNGLLMRTGADLHVAQELGARDIPTRLLPDLALHTRGSGTSNFDLPKNKTVILAFRGGAKSEKAANLAQHLVAAGLVPAYAIMHAGEDGGIGELPEGAVRLPFLSPEELVGLMRDCRAVAGDRLHGLILAVAAGVCAVGLSDGGKTDAFCELCRKAGGADRIQAVRDAESMLAFLLSCPAEGEDGGLLSRLHGMGENFSFRAFFSLL